MNHTYPATNSAHLDAFECALFQCNAWRSTNSMSVNIYCRPVVMSSRCCVRCACLTCQQRNVVDKLMSAPGIKSHLINVYSIIHNQSASGRTRTGKRISHRVLSKQQTINYRILSKWNYSAHAVLISGAQTHAQANGKVLLVDIHSERLRCMPFEPRGTEKWSQPVHCSAGRGNEVMQFGICALVGMCAATHYYHPTTEMALPSGRWVVKLLNFLTFRPEPSFGMHGLLSKFTWNRYILYIYIAAVVGQDARPCALCRKHRVRYLYINPINLCIII